MVGFDDGTDKSRVLNGSVQKTINANLGSAANVTTAKSLPDNQRLSFMGDTKGGKFDITESTAFEMLSAPNPNGRPNSDVVVPWINGLDVTRRPRSFWIIDFGVEMPVDVAALYEKPFSVVASDVKPLRDNNKRESYRDRWWIHVEPRPALRVIGAARSVYRYD